jgi:hypothetical protein
MCSLSKRTGRTLKCPPVDPSSIKPSRATIAAKPQNDVVVKQAQTLIAHATPVRQGGLRGSAADDET